MRFGASYYHEYQPYDRLDTDLDLMADAGFTVIRVGESTWASYEPEEGEFSFDPLRRVIRAAHFRGLEVIVGTPTYAIPPWLARRHPEVMARDITGRPVPFGGRQNVDFNHPTFREYAGRIVTQLARATANLPGVIGFQMDNEIGVRTFGGAGNVEQFRSYLIARHGDVETINRRWGLVYWSHRLADIADVWAPEGNTNPGYALEWDRFQASLPTDFLAWQLGVLRPHLRKEQFVIHDQPSGHSNQNTAQREIAALTDHTAVNVYAPLQSALELPEPPADAVRPLAPQWTADAGTWSAVWRADMARALRGQRGEPFFVTEAQAGTIGDSDQNYPPYPGQLRLLAHLLAARGADLLAYWHWHSLHFGWETYWGGVLPHDLQPGRIYDEVAELGRELLKLTPVLQGLIPESDVAVLYSKDSRRALQFMPPFCEAGSADPEPDAYHVVLARLQEALLDQGMQARVLFEESDWQGEQVLLVPALYVADTDLLQRVVRHAAGGAHVVCTFRTGYADEWAQVRTDRQPAHIAGALGAWYQEFTNLSEPVKLRAGDGLDGLTLPPTATGSAWADCLRLESAQVLAWYEDEFLQEHPAIVTRPVGQGRLTWVGTLPDRETMAEVLDWARRERGLARKIDDMGQLPASVRVNTATTPSSGRLWFVANHSWVPTFVEIPHGLRLIDAVTKQPTTQLKLGSWSSTILLEDER